VTPAFTEDPQNRLAAGLGLGGGVLAIAGTFLDWSTISIGGLTAPGGSATGWEGRDGRTVLAGAVASIIAAVLIALGTRRLAPKIVLIVAGGITSVVAIAGIADASGKADAVRDEFAIPAARITAEVGVGLWLVAVAGIVEVAAGVAARQPGGGPGLGDAVTRGRSSGRRAGGSATSTAR
jgi:hypothetical protein